MAYLVEDQACLCETVDEVPYENLRYGLVSMVKLSFFPSIIVTLQ